MSHDDFDNGDYTDNSYVDWEAVQQEDAMSHDWRECDDYMSQYDDDPSPYSGTYSEE